MNINDLIKKIEVKDIKYTIDKIKTKQDCAIFYLNNDEKIKVSLEDYFKYKHLKGINENIYQELLTNQKFLKAYNGCLYRLSNKDYTVKQIKNYLYSKFDLEKADIDNIIEKLLNLNLLNDERYCLSNIDYLSKSNYSYKQIRTKLLKDGLNEELIDKNLTLNHDDELNNAIFLAQKINKTINNKSLNNTKQTILNRLQAKGFSYDVSKNALNSIIINNDNEIDILSKEYQKALNKYKKRYENYELKNHIYAYLINKGFQSNDIKEVMENQND